MVRNEDWMRPSKYTGLYNISGNRGFMLVFRFKDRHFIKDGLINADYMKRINKFITRVYADMEANYYTLLDDYPEQFPNEFSLAKAIAKDINSSHSNISTYINTFLWDRRSISPTRVVVPKTGLKILRSTNKLLRKVRREKHES